ncbi:unnamed protein product, partial [Ectocarpus sp. 12 AP-2014]
MLESMLRLIVLLMALMFAAPAARADAETVRDRIVSVLREDGYGEIRISRTLLGRMRFVGLRMDARREIVVNPNSGVVLRDYVRFLNRSLGGSSSSGSSGNYDDDDDYDDDDHDDDDNSGPGNSSDDDDDKDSSGSGSS